MAFEKADNLAKLSGQKAEPTQLAVSFDHSFLPVRK